MSSHPNSRLPVYVPKDCEDLSGHKALQAAHDLGLRLAFLQPPLGVVLGGLVPPEADDDDSVEGGVGLTVATPIQAVSVGLARRCRDRVRATEGGECRF